MDYGRDLEQLLEELSEDKLSYAPPRTVLEDEEVDVSSLGFERGEDSGDSGEEFIEGREEANIKDVKGLPELIVGIIDIFAAGLAEVWTQTDDKSKYRLEEEEREQLIKAWELYLKNSAEVRLSPSTMLFLTTGIIYAPRVLMAMNERKDRLKNQSLQEG